MGASGLAGRTAATSRRPLGQDATSSPAQRKRGRPALTPAPDDPAAIGAARRTGVRAAAQAGHAHELSCRTGLVDWPATTRRVAATESIQSAWCDPHARRSPRWTSATPAQQPADDERGPLREYPGGAELHGDCAAELAAPEPVFDDPAAYRAYRSCRF